MHRFPRVALVLLAGAGWIALSAPAAPAQVPAGPEIAVNEYTPGHQMFSHPEFGADGSFVVVWSSSGGGNGNGVFARRFSPSGVPVGGDFRVDGALPMTLGAAAPRIASRANGEFLVVWSFSDTNSLTAVDARRLDRQGVPLGAPFRIAEAIGSEGVGGPDVAVDAANRFVVVWVDRYRDGSYVGVSGRRFDAAGTPLGDEFRVNLQTVGNQNQPGVAVAPDGSFVVVWTDYAWGDGDEAGIIGRRYAASGAPVGGEFIVNSYTPLGQRLPSISASPTGGFVVTWLSAGLSARRLDTNGNPVGQDFLASSPTTQVVGDFRGGGVSHDGGGNFVVTWPAVAPTGWDVFGQRFTPTGTRRGAEFRVNTYTTSTQDFPSVATEPNGNFVVAWRTYRQQSYGRDIVARRFGGLRPSSLAVVDGGNGVLEVPDNFGLTTSWQNVSGAPQTFQGQASEFTGPPGLVYTLGSTTADYGTVADGSSAPCSGSCFSGALLGARPPGHVDVSVREKIVPDALGQDYRWILHVGKSFDDVLPSNAYYRFVETLLHRGVTGGCGPTAYCPAAATARDQMAVFVLIAKERAGYAPPPCGATPMFADVPVTSPYCRWVEELARRGVVGGCGGGNYCAAAAVSREQMAVFVLRTLDPALSPPACGTPVFADVPASSPFCRWIEELARRGIVTGCGGGNYCPGAPVTREQMGVFIGVTFGLTLYGP